MSNTYLYIHNGFFMGIAIGTDAKFLHPLINYDKYFTDVIECSRYLEYSNIEQGNI